MKRSVPFRAVGRCLAPQTKAVLTKAGLSILLTLAIVDHGARADDWVRVVGVDPSDPDGLVIRAEPSPHADVVGHIPATANKFVRDDCQVKGRSTWCSIYYRRMSGWVNGKYLEVIQENAGTASNSKPQLRSQPRAETQRPEDLEGGYTQAISQLEDAKAKYQRLLVRADNMLIGLIRRAGIDHQVDVEIPSFGKIYVKWHDAGVEYSQSAWIDKVPDVTLDYNDTPAYAAIKLGCVETGCVESRKDFWDRKDTNAISFPVSKSSPMSLRDNIAEAISIRIDTDKKIQRVVQLIRDAENAKGRAK